MSDMIDRDATPADRIAALTEQLAAARRDAEEAEAYAGELEANGLANRVAIMRLEARAERLEAAMIQMRDDRTAFRHAVHFRRFITNTLTTEDRTDG